MYRNIGFGSSEITDGDASDGVVVAGGLRFQVFASGDWNLNFDNGRLNFSEDPLFSNEQFRIVITNPSGGNFAYRDFTVSYEAVNPTFDGGWPSTLDVGNLPISDTSYTGPGDDTFSYQRDFSNQAPVVTTSSLVIRDTAPYGSSDNPTSSFWLDNLVVDTDLPPPNVRPSVSSIVRTDAASNGVPASATSVSYTVTFSEAVTGVDKTDFLLTKSGSANGTVDGVSGSGTTYIVTVNGLAGDGALRLDLKGSGTGIVDSESAPIAGGYSAGQSFTLDRTPPTLAISSDKAALSAGQTATITFTFSEDPGASFSWDGASGDVVVSGGTLSAITGSGLTRAATFTPAAGTDNGTASITVAAGTYTDAAGNDGAAANTPFLSFDTNPPAAPAIPQLAASSDSGVLSDNVTNVVAPTFTGAAGSAEAGATLRLYDTDGTTELGSTTVNGDGSWEVNSSALGQGTHTITANVTDAAGNVGAASNALIVTIDATAPASPGSLTLDIASDSGSSDADGITKIVTPTFNGTAEAGANVTLYDTDGTTVIASTTANENGLWSVASSALADGPHTVTATATDAAGNTGLASGDLNVTIDTSAPAVPSTPSLAAASDSGISDADHLTNIATPTFSGTAEAGSTVSLYDTDGTTLLGSTVVLGDGSWSVITSALDEGAHTITTAAVDVAGNVSAASSGTTVNIDLTAPGVAISSDKASLQAGGTALITFQFDERPAGFDGGDIAVTGGKIGSLTATGDPLVYTAIFTPQAGFKGNASFTITNGYTDIAGNYGTGDVLSIAVDTIVLPPAPSPPVTTTPNPDGSTSIILTQPQTSEQLAQFATPGIDTVSSPFAVTLPDGIENVTLTGSDNVNATGNNGANAITGNAGNNVLTGDAPAGSASIVAASEGIGSSNLMVGGSDTISGGLGNDIVYGNQGADILFGNQGNDFLYGGKDDDFVYGGKDDDYIEGNLGNDYVEGNLGNDIVNGNQGDDTVLGNQGNDTVHGGQGDDLVHGGQGDDIVLGDKGDDRIWGDLGNDTLTGGEGTDTFFFALNSGNDVIIDFDRTEGDTLDFQGQSYSVVDVNGSAVFTLSGGGTVVLTGVSAASLDAAAFV